MSPAQIRQQGLDALVKALGPVGIVRFLHQFDMGSGDYTGERSQYLQQFAGGFAKLTLLRSCTSPLTRRGINSKGF